MSKDVLTIREMTLQEVGPVISLSKDLGLSPWSAADYRAEMARHDSILLIGRKRSELAGFIVGRMIPGSSSEESVDAEIYNIGIDPQFHRSGVGTDILGRFFSICRDKAVESVWLEVRAGNASAIRFYRKHGFERISIRRAFYQNPPDDGVVMRNELRPAETSVSVNNA